MTRTVDHLDPGGFAAVMGILVFSLLYARHETRPVRRWWRQAQARTQELLDQAVDAGYTRPGLPSFQELANLAPDPAPEPGSLDDTRPEDLDLCPVCDGEGGWTRQVDPFRGAFETDECWACGGTGVRGAA